MPRYQSKPVIIEASRWFENGDHPLDYASPRIGTKNVNGELVPVKVSGDFARRKQWEGEIVRRFNRPDVPGNQPCEHCTIEMRLHGWIDTPQGGHTVCPGDWIITEPDGNGYYPCKPTVFALRYEGPISDDAIVPA